MIIGATLAVGIVTGVLLKIEPDTYSSTVTLLVSSRMDDPVSGRESNIGSSYGGTQYLNSYIATQIEYIRSPVILFPVVEKFHLAAHKDYMLGYVGDNSEASRRQWAKESLRERLTVVQGTGSLFMYITVDDQDPSFAADLANGIADSYLTAQRKRFLDPATDRAVRYSEQLKSLKGKIDEAQAKVSKFRRQTGLTNLKPDEGPYGGKSARLSDLESRLTEASAQRLNAELRLGRIGRGDATVLSSTVVQSLKAKLQASEAKMAELRATLGPRHPNIVALQTEIDQARMQLDQEISVYVDGARAEVNSARSVEERLQKELKEEREAIMKARSQQDEAAQLLRELDSATKIYEAALDAFETVQLGKEIASSNVEIVNRAVPPSQPNRSQKRKIMMIVVSAALIVSSLIALMLELLNRKIRSREDIERELGLPVLVQLQGKA